MLYKYRGIKEFRYFVDIVLNKRFYAAPYFDLNDPMEGHYLYNSGELDSDVRDLIKSQKEKLRICSLSKVADNELMWSHYAEGHRGVAIGVTVNESKHAVVPVDYDGPLQIERVGIHNATAQEILSHKLKVWSYEEEVRVFIRNKQYVDVKVEEVLLGRSMSKQDIGFIKKLIASVDESIEVKGASSKYD
ncbi:DUF2971 domain-containing protein [Mariprofundus sp. NF]|uniref:DUF2971 domain-containing protein n=1 Tax=Mariprofundus sp. NF TaxID=2608716 RepID=UPI0019D5D4F0